MFFTVEDNNIRHVVCSGRPQAGAIAHGLDADGAGSTKSVPVFYMGPLVRPRLGQTNGGM